MEDGIARGSDHKQLKFSTGLDRRLLMSFAALTLRRN
jgi:hypothetical protein